MICPFVGGPLDGQRVNVHPVADEIVLPHPFRIDWSEPLIELVSGAGVAATYRRCAYRSARRDVPGIPAGTRLYAYLAGATEPPPFAFVLPYADHPASVYPCSAYPPRRIAGGGLYPVQPRNVRDKLSYVRRILDPKPTPPAPRG